MFRLLLCSLFYLYFLNTELQAWQLPPVEFINDFCSYHSIKYAHFILPATSKSNVNLVGRHFKLQSRDQRVMYSVQSKTTTRKSRDNRGQDLVVFIPDDTGNAGSLQQSLNLFKRLIEQRKTRDRCFWLIDISPLSTLMVNVVNELLYFFCPLVFLFVYFLF